MSGPGRKPTISDNEILTVFEEADDPVLTTKEVSASIDLGHRGTFDRLKQLAEDGDLRMKKVGETGAVWWHPSRVE